MHFTKTFSVCFLVAFLIFAAEIVQGSSQESIMIDTQPPDPPSLISPANHMKTNELTPTFSWAEPADSGGSGIKNYRIYIDNEPTFTAPRVKEYTTSNTHYTPSLYEGYYFWKVYARDTAGNQSDWSEVWEFEIDITPPVSVCSSPDFKNSGTIPVAWTANDTASSGVAYTKLYYKYETGGVWAYSTGDSACGPSGTFNFNPPSGDGMYYFQTITTDSADNTEPGPSGHGEGSTFYDTQPPSEPSLTSPTNGSNTNDTTPTFTWNASTDPAPSSSIKNHRILIDDESGFSTPYVKDHYTSSTSYTPSLNEGQYYWKVLARDNADNSSSWSSTWMLEIDTTPPYSICSSPDHIVSGTIPVSWTADDTASSGVSYTKLYYKYETGGIWTYSTGDSAGGTSGTFSFNPPSGDGTYYFQTISTDSADNTEPGPSGNGDDSTAYIECFDTDGDSLCDEDDNCPSIYNPGQEDTDSDNFGDACDIDQMPLEYISAMDYEPELDFPYLDCGWRCIGDTACGQVTVTNSGTLDVIIVQACIQCTVVAGSECIYFYAEPPVPRDEIVEPGKSVTVHICYDPFEEPPLQGFHWDRCFDAAIAYRLPDDPRYQLHEIYLEGKRATEGCYLGRMEPVHDFGNVAVGYTWEWRMVVSNTGCEPLTLSEITSNRPEFTIISPTFPLTVAEHSHQEVLVQFTPSGMEHYSGLLTVVSDAMNRDVETGEQIGNIEIEVKGVGIEAVLGDVNSDGEVNVLDVMTIVNIILGNVQPTEDQIQVADMNRDGNVNIMDCVVLTNMILTEQPR